MEIYNKYKIEHTDGTPLKGKDYFVLRLDSDNPSEAARVNAAMRAYTGRLRNCDVGTAEEHTERFHNFCKMDYISGDCPDDCPLYRKDCSTIRCPFAWAQTPYEAQEGGAS